jgi:hypothetical protein
MRGTFRYGERRLVLKRDLMHADAADQIAMAAKSTSLRDPVPAWRFVELVPRSDPLKLEMPVCSLF